MNIAMFDFDGTITTKDTFLGFCRYAVGPFRFMLGLGLAGPLFLGYGVGLMPVSRGKEFLLRHFFRNLSIDEFNQVASNYARTMLPLIIDPRAMERIHWHRTRDDLVIVVSGSVDSWLREWCTQNDLDLISSTLELDDGRITGRLLNGDCVGKEKRRRIEQKYSLEDFGVVYAYGDSSGDKDMLALAHEPYLRWKKCRTGAKSRP